MEELPPVNLKRILKPISPMKNGSPLLFSIDHNFLKFNSVTKFQINEYKSSPQIGSKNLVVKSKNTEYLTYFTL